MMSQRIRWIVYAICFFAVLWLGGGTAMAQAIEQPSPDMLAIQGRWTRTDAPYVIELRHAKDGSMQATYFNPKPINVSKTKQRSRVVWSRS